VYTCVVSNCSPKDSERLRTASTPDPIKSHEGTYIAKSALQHYTNGVSFVEKLFIKFWFGASHKTHS
jgi:hypothetical protein